MIAKWAMLMFSMLIITSMDGFVLRNLSKNRSDSLSNVVGKSSDELAFENIRAQRLSKLKSRFINSDNDSQLVLKLLKHDEQDYADFNESLSKLTMNESLNLLNLTNFATTNYSNDDGNILGNVTLTDRIGDKHDKRRNVLKTSELDEIKKKLTEILKNYGEVNSDNGTLSIVFNVSSSDNETNEEHSLFNETVSPVSVSTMSDKNSLNSLSLEKIVESNPSNYNLWLEKFQNSGYEKNVRPYHGLKPLEIRVSIHVIRVHSISESTMDFGLDIYYRENWTDPRLAYDQSDFGDEILNVPSSAADVIWIPDTYFSNALHAETEVPGSVTHRSLLRIYPNGNVFYIRKISLTADCAMDLGLYPFDKQGCKLIMNSYSFLKKDLYYIWRDGDPIDFQERVRLPEFQLLQHKTRAVDEDYYIGTYSTLHLCLVFKRSAGFCIMQIFFPATAVVMSSWVSLWMEEETQFNDVLAVILAIIFLAYSYNSVMPRVSYVKLLDLYLAACFLFVFLSLSKLVILKYCRKKWHRKYQSPTSNSPMDVFKEVVLADEESSAIGSSGEEDNVKNNNCNSPRMENNHKSKYNKAKLKLQRRVTLAKIEMEKTKRNLAAEKRFLRYLRAFHVVTQLVLPLGFISFFVFILIIYPNWPRPPPC